MLTQEIIRIKRDGGKLSAAQIEALISGLPDGRVSEAQAAAFAMAVFFRGMDMEERVALTMAMRDSGRMLEWDLPGPIVDKHSTGGVGDNVSLVLAPALAACGAFVSTISGRGLGHTGGTLDKFDSIPGYNTRPDIATFRKVVRDCGCAIVGQTADLAPADGVLYGIRDVTATVASIDLITSSILSKKLAAGLGTLMLDVKCGNGAFMTTLAEAEELARSLVSVANAAGCRTSALITNMDEPLASAAGNAVEVLNAVDFLTGAHVDNRLWDLTVALGGDLLHTAGVETTPALGAERIADVLSSGHAAECFGKMVAALGGPTDFVENARKYLPVAPVQIEIFAQTEGFVQAIQTRDLGLAVVELGGGRRVAGDKIRYDVGLSEIAGIGRMVNGDEPLCILHAANTETAELAAQAVRDAVTIGDTPVCEPELIMRRVGPEDV